ncbi:HAMP domain-containing histidine kinase [Sphingomonas sp. CL5.1]|uniref:ATP-binding protein n=1 Tax=Sphingomonas sp. CL5.1 TaxID=2653203 RepID=UPI001581861B|nr:ATP-binding protein [Sphingomonas sp. CL5.1]QKS01790.1 HAMP domain-containing histidine kinase [Sphingomonas sp. CL5.1]
MSLPPRPQDAARRNLLLLILLRWLAVGGQLATILVVEFGMGIRLPLAPMLTTLAGLVVLNLVQLATARFPVTNAELLGALLIDVAALGVQLALSGGATNPFVTLFLLQVVLGAVLLEAWSSWLLVAVTSAAFALLAFVHRPLPLPPEFASRLSVPYMLGSWFNFTLAAVLAVLFVTRGAANLRQRDAHLAAMRSLAAEQEQIVRMGLLASGAAHELGTPLSTLSVTLGDWRHEAEARAFPRLAGEIAELEAEVARCKEILAGILFAAGEVTGEAPARTTLRRFVQRIVERWGRPELVTLDDCLWRDPPIVADRALAQTIVNLLDNAIEAGASHVTLTYALDDAGDGGEEEIVIAARDDGRGFPPEFLDGIGRPYQSSKERRGAGLGLFLASNVLRTLGGSLEARNDPRGGAVVVLRLPLATLSLEKKG